MAAMRRGDFATAWEISDTALRLRAHCQRDHLLPRHLQNLWDGTSLAGRRVLIRCFHGLGDTIQFIRYAPLVAEIAREVIVQAQPALLELLRGVAGIDRLLPLHDGEPVVDFDLEVEIMELPHIFRAAVAALPMAVPYVYARPATLAGSQFSVGLVWQGGDWDPRRDVPVQLLAKLREIRGVTLHALQRGRGFADWKTEWGPVSGSDRVDEAARVMQSMDLIITVDSFPAHLAGALGRPTWTLLHAEPDWRWLLERDDSPWYPTMRLFRQQHPGDWAPVIKKVARELRRLAAQTASASMAGA